jgi:hypothetical protein
MRKWGVNLDGMLYGPLPAGSKPTRTRLFYQKDGTTATPNYRRCGRRRRQQAEVLPSSTVLPLQCPRAEATPPCARINTGPYVSYVAAPIEKVECTTPIHRALRVTWTLYTPRPHAATPTTSPVCGRWPLSPVNKASAPVHTGHTVVVVRAVSAAHRSRFKRRTSMLFSHVLGGPGFDSI